ncbi:MAG: hypothetical protein J7639_25985, partial [Paenibacillaceae bacterium]|nr:hypothetical protein [Paenibacillaceae bacterium]
FDGLFIRSFSCLRLPDCLDVILVLGSMQNQWVIFGAIQENGQIGHFLLPIRRRLLLASWKSNHLSPFPSIPAIVTIKRERSAA